MALFMVEAPTRPDARNSLEARNAPHAAQLYAQVYGAAPHVIVTDEDGNVTHWTTHQLVTYYARPKDP